MCRFGRVPYDEARGDNRPERRPPHGSVHLCAEGPPVNTKHCCGERWEKERKERRKKGDEGGQPVRAPVSDADASYLCSRDACWPPNSCVSMAFPQIPCSRHSPQPPALATPANALSHVDTTLIRSHRLLVRPHETHKSAQTVSQLSM